MKKIIENLISLVVTPLSALTTSTNKKSVANECYKRYQCEARSSSASEFNCCIKEDGHKGLHMSADGHTWF